MKFFGDYHTHTIYSRKPYIFYNHAKGSIEDNIIEAKNIGLKELAITDHGFSHRYFGCSRKNLKTTKEEILRLSQKYDIKVYFGVESNFISQDGTIDVVESDKEYLDIILCGFHRSAKPKTLGDKFKVFWSNMFAKFFGTSFKLKQRNTLMILKALDKNKIDVITHLNSKMKCDVVEVAKKAAEKGTYLELNERHCDFTSEEIKGMLQTKVNFIVNSDSHKPNKIGKFSKVEKLIKENNIPEDRVANLNSLPKFINLKNKTTKD